jgi:hypothetical protein
MKPLNIVIFYEMNKHNDKNNINILVNNKKANITKNVFLLNFLN